MSKQMQEAVKVFKNGGIVIFPTDTAVGIGCRLDKENSLKRLFEIRKRPKNKPLLVLVDSIEMAQNYLLPIPQKIKDKLINRYWPGKLTIIFKCDTDKVPSLVRNGGTTLGVRLPDNLKLRELIKEVGIPIVAPSANFSGEKTPFKFEELNPNLEKLADYILKEDADLQKNVSTIIDCTVTPWKIIREGGIKYEDINY
jgi:L-threonylcarbamoyladenylate synthase